MKSSALSDLVKRISASLSKYRSSPQRSPVLQGYQIPLVLFSLIGIVWKKRSREPLRELLAQMGFQRLEWERLRRK